MDYKYWKIYNIKGMDTVMHLGNGDKMLLRDMSDNDINEFIEASYLNLKVSTDRWDIVVTNQVIIIFNDVKLKRRIEKLLKLKANICSKKMKELSV